MTEEWKAVARAPLYEVSNLGRVRRTAGFRCKATRILSLRKITDGYVAAHLCVNGRRFNGPVHQLVCEAFHGPRPSQAHQVGHWDGNPQNNASENLRWVTVTENAADRRRHGTDGAAERNGNVKLSANDVEEIRTSASSSTVLAARFAVTRHQIWRIRSGRSWSMISRKEAA